MPLNRRTFLSRLGATTTGLTAASAAGQALAGQDDAPGEEKIVSDVLLPAFSVDEYNSRLDRVRAEMAMQEIDLIYVTQPAHMCYLHGYQCSWYRAATTSAWPPMAGTAVHVDHDKPIHFDYTDEVGQLRETSVVEDKRFFPAEQSLDTAVPFLIGELESEGWLKGSTVGLEFWSFVPPRAVSEAVEAALLDGGASKVVDGSFVVRSVRRIKSAREIAYIEKGVELADLALRTASEVARPGVMECEVYAEAMRAMYVAGGEIQGINQGFNVRDLPHTMSGRHRIQAGDRGGFDVCGVVNRYHGNVARSFYFREPDRTTRDAFALSAEAFDIVCEVARPGTDVTMLNKALREHFEPGGGWDNVYYIGGYELGIAFPPDWVGEWMFDAVNGVAPGVFEAGMVTNFESIFFFEDELGEIHGTSNINTIVYGEDETRALSSLPPEPFVIA